MKSMRTFVSSFAVLTLAGIATAQTMPIPENQIRDLQATRAIRIDRNFKTYGDWIEVSQEQTPQLVNIINGYDGNNVNPALMPGSAAFQNFYGPTSAGGVGFSWTYGALTNWPASLNDMNLNPAATRKSAQMFRTLNRWNPAGTNPASGTARLMVAVYTGHGFDPVYDIMDGWLIQFGPNAGVAGGYYRLTANFSGTNVSFPLPDGTGHVLVFVGTLDGGGAFVKLPAPGTASPGFNNTTDPADPQWPGTNPSSSGPLAYIDADADFAITFASEFYTFDQTAGGNGWWSPVQAFFVDTDWPTISGTCTLEDLNAGTTRPVKNIHVVMTAAGDPGTVIKTDNVALGPNGEYEIAAPTAMGTYDLYFEVMPHWLRRLSAGVMYTGSSIAGVNVSLSNGDVDGDNEVGISDYAILSSSYGTFFGDPGYEINADVDHDDEVGISDYAILSGNYGEFGD